MPALVVRVQIDAATVLDYVLLIRVVQDAVELVRLGKGVMVVSRCWARHGPASHPAEAWMVHAIRQRGNR